MSQMKRDLRVTTLEDVSRHLRKLIGMARDTAPADEATERRLHQALAHLWAAADSLECAPQ